MKKIKNIFTDISIIFFIFFFLTFFINIASYVVIKIYKDNLPPPMVQGYGDQLEKKLDGAYPGLNFSDIQDIYEDFENMPLEFENYSMFTEKKNYTSKYLNISNEGFRKIKNQKPINTNKKKIFIFGSSPTFGYNLRDEDTIASHLQEIIGNDYAVFNFARGYYYSRQQLSLLINLINNQSLIPDYVIFVNNHANERGLIGPNTSDGAYKRIAVNDKKLHLREFLPFIKIMQFIIKKFKLSDHEIALKKSKNFTAKEDIDYFMRTNELVKKFCDFYNIEFYSFYAPAYGYKYKNFENDPLTRDNSVYDAKSTKMFEIIDNQFNNKEMPGYFFNLLELGQEEGRLYVDTAHYSSKMSKLIADRINKILKK